MSFVNLHSHSHYSLLDGFGSPEAMIKRAKELGYPAQALTDHGVTYGLIDLYKAGKKHGVKPILGCEFYVSRRTRFDKEAKVDIKPYHLTVLAKNNEGYKNILKMTTQAHLEGFYYKPRIDYDLLEEHSEGLVILSGCMAAHLPRAILAENEEDIHMVIKKFIAMVGKENYFLEMQHNPYLEAQEIINSRLRKLAKEYDLQLVVTCDSHYPCLEDKDVHDVLLCIQTGKTVGDEDRMRYSGDYSIRDVEELKKAFPDCPEAIANTVKIAEMCNVDFKFGVNLIPKFDTPNGESADIYLRELCEDGLRKRFEGAELPEGYMDRLNYELEMVHNMGFDTYFLIVSDFVKYAKGKDIVVGPGRGSAAGSIISWALDITDVDPLKYGLFFERFLNPERVSMPDIDIDFSDTRRGEVLDYVVEKYGRDKVAQIITYGTMAPKAAIRDAGRALGYPYAEVDALSKAVPPATLGKYAPLVESLEEDPQLSKIYRTDSRAKTLLDFAKRLEGTVRHVGTHACAVVISEKPLPEYTALQYGAGGGGEIVTQYDAGPLEALGLLKMDFLGLRNLTIIETTTKIVERTRKEEVDILKLPMDDEATFKLLQKGDTTGVFQLESGGMRRYLKELKPTEFNDIVAMGALYRPGPMEWIPTYIKGKHKPEGVKYLHDSFKEVLSETYGVAVYQEQILQLARDFAGFTLGEADILRKAVGKKIPALLVEQREKFVKGAVDNGHKKKFAKEVFEKVVEPFAGYGFNKAHAVCYGLIAYQTAYLKAHYPIEFMTALLCSDAGNTDRVVLEIKECVEMGFEVMSISINESFAHFTVVDEKRIRFGLLAVKGVGEGPIREIISVREAGGPFKSLEDLAKRVPAKILNKKLIQALAYSGGLDEFGDRNQIAESYGMISKYAKDTQEAGSDGQASIFGLMDESEHSHFDFKLVDAPKATDMQKLKWEKDYLGMYVSGHPLKGLQHYIARKVTMMEHLTKANVGKNVKVLGLISEVRKIMTKAGKYMAVFTIEDTGAKINCVMFPRAFDNFGDAIVEDTVAVFNGKLDDRQGQYQISVDSAKMVSLRVMIENAKESQMFLEDELASVVVVRRLDDILADKEIEDEVQPDLADNKEAVADGPYKIRVPETVDASNMKKLKELLMENRGDTPTELYLAGAKKTIKLPFGISISDDLQLKIEELLV